LQSVAAPIRDTYSAGDRYEPVACESQPFPR